jgi:hypothetical protein
LERCDPEVAGDVVGTYGARRPADPGQVAQPRRERGVDGHRVGAGGQGVAKQPERLVVTALDSGVGHLEAADLDPARVVALDHGRVHGALGVGDQLAAGIGQLAQVAAERVDERGGGVRADPTVRTGELALHERDLVALPLDRLAVDDGGPGFPRGVQERLALGTSVVDQDQHDALRRRRDVLLELGGNCLGRLAGVAHHDDVQLAEERRGRQAGHVSRLETHDRQVVHLHGRVRGPRVREHLRDRTVAQEVLGTGDEGDGRRQVGHRAPRYPPPVTSRADRPEPATSTVPSRSVRPTTAPDRRSAASVDGAG